MAMLPKGSLEPPHRICISCGTKLHNVQTTIDGKHSELPLCCKKCMTVNDALVVSDDGRMFAVVNRNAYNAVRDVLRKRRLTGYSWHGTPPKSVRLPALTSCGYVVIDRHIQFHKFTEVLQKEFMDRDGESYIQARLNDIEDAENEIAALQEDIHEYENEIKDYPLKEIKKDRLNRLYGVTHDARKGTKFT